jgi:hypothetical protein
MVSNGIIASYQTMPESITPIEDSRSWHPILLKAVRLLSDLWVKSRVKRMADSFPTLQLFVVALGRLVSALMQISSSFSHSRLLIFLILLELMLLH